jgi:hypothetical protein
MQDIEKEFSASWNHIQAFYEELINKHGWDWLNPILNLIDQLRACGFDRKLRAGQSMWRFWLSRSKKHGLRDNQPFLEIDVHPDASMNVVYWDSVGVVAETTVERVELTPELEGLLAQLAAQPLD